MVRRDRDRSDPGNLHERAAGVPTRERRRRQRADGRRNSRFDARRADRGKQRRSILDRQSRRPTRDHRLFHPTGFVVPASLNAFANGDPVDENYALPGGSDANGAGLTTQGGPAQDAGVLGAPTGQVAGEMEEVRRDLFFPTSSSPAPTTVLGPNQPIMIDFSATLSAGSVDGTTVRATTAEGGASLNIGLNTAGSQLTIDAPPGGWGNADFVIELHRGVMSQSGIDLTTPIAIPYQR